MKILVTGGAGYVGGTVAALLASQGHNPIVFDNLSHSRRELLPPGIDFVEGDLADRALLQNLFADAAKSGYPFDAVLHFAALIEAGESMHKPEIYFRNNTASTLSLLKQSSLTGRAAWSFPLPRLSMANRKSVPIPETARLNPTNVYGESKLLADPSSAGSIGFTACAMPPCGTSTWLGPRRSGRRCPRRSPRARIPPDSPLLDVAFGRRDSVRIYGEDYPTPDGTCIRDYIHVSDLADAHLLALKASRTTKKLILNLGNGQGFSVLEVIESARRITGHPIPAEVYPRRPGDPAVLVASSDKAIRELGWSLNTPSSTTSSAPPGSGTRNATPTSYPWEAPRLWRGGSRSLTFTGVHPRNSRS